MRTLRRTCATIATLRRPSSVNAAILRGALLRSCLAAGAATALVARGPLRAGARQLRSSQPLRMAASTLEGLRNVAIVAHVRRSVRASNAG